MSTPPFSILHTMAQISNIAYYNDIVLAERQFSALGYSIKRKFDTGGSEAFLLTNDVHWVLVFRGVEFKEKADLAAISKVIKTKEGSGKVHLGFKAHADKIWNEILEIVPLCDCTLYLTGHSLGGAIATIAASRLHHAGMQDLIVCTFGCPRVGNRKFVAGINSVTHFRVKNTTDFATTIPKFGYVHHGEEVYLDYYGNHVEGRFWAMYKNRLVAKLTDFRFFNNMRNHLITEYIRKLANLS